MKNVKVCMISTVHRYDDTRIFHKQAKSLIKAGYDVTIIAQGDGPTSSDGIKVLSLNKPATRFERFFVTGVKAYRKARGVDCDIYHFHDPELLLLGFLLSMGGKKVIYDVHEDVPKQILDKVWIWKPLRFFIAKIVNRFEKHLSKHFEGVVAATTTIAEQFSNNKLGVYTVHNYVVKDLFKQNSNTQLDKHETNNKIVYIGDITVLRGIYSMVDAITLIPDSYDISLILGGRFSPPSLRKRLRQHKGWQRVSFLGWLDYNQLRNVLDNSLAGLVLIHPEPRYIVSYPVKMFEYMAAGIPVIASNFPLWKEIIEGNSCGITVDPLDSKAVAKAIIYLLDNPEEAQKMGKNGKEAVKRQYNWEEEEQKLIELYNAVSSTL